MKKNDIEEVTVKFKRKIVGKNELWRYRQWSTKGKVFLVLDAYPAKGERSVLSESLTDVLVSEQIQKLGGRGYYLLHTFTVQTQIVGEGSLALVDYDMVETIFNEIELLSESIDEVIIVTGSLERKYHSAKKRIDDMKDLFQKLDIDYRYLIDPETTLPASPTFRIVRQGGIDWQLK